MGWSDAIAAVDTRASLSYVSLDTFNERLHRLSVPSASAPIRVALAGGSVLPPALPVAGLKAISAICPARQTCGRCPSEPELRPRASSSIRRRRPAQPSSTPTVNVAAFSKARIDRASTGRNVARASASCSIRSVSINPFWVDIRCSCPAGSCSGSASPGRSPPRPTLLSWTSRRVRWICPSAPASSLCCAASRSKPECRCCSSAMTF